MIYTRVDTYSVMLYDCKIDDILKVFKIDIDFKSAFSRSEADKKAKGYKKTDVKLGDKFVFSFNGLRFEANLNEYEIHKEADNVFCIPFSSIRFYISSEGVDYIESLTDKSLQEYLSDLYIWDSISIAHKVTRCDFCFDYINYSGNEFDRLRKLIANADFDERLSPSGRFLNGTQSGVSYSYHGGSERTIYLGSGNRLLRIYDKKFQLTDSAGNFQSEKLPKQAIKNEVTIDSWHRVEFQCRDPYAEPYLISCAGNWEFIMGEIANLYDVRFADGKHLPPLHKIFLWTKRTPIIQNANSIYKKSLTESKTNWIANTALRATICSIGALGGIRNYIDFLNDSVTSRAESDNFEQRTAFIMRLNAEISIIASENGIKFDEFGNIPGLYKHDNGAWYIRKDFLGVTHKEQLLVDFLTSKYPSVYQEFVDKELE